MAKTTILFGALLTLLGLITYFGAESLGASKRSMTALIPAFVGLPLAILGVVAQNPGARKHAMHAAVAVGLLGALAALARGVPAALAGDAARPAVMSQLAMGVLLLIYVALGVQSFIAARKARMGRAN